MPTRDPDELLDAFAELTAREPAPVSSSARPPLSRRLAAAGVAVVLIASIGGLAVIYGPRLVPAGAGDRIELVTHHLTEAIGGRHTGIAGVPVVRDGSCLYMTIPGERQWLTVWPSGTTIDESEDPPIVRDADGDRITTVGEDFSLGGTSFDADRLEDLRPYLDGDVPEQCLGADLLLIDPGVAALHPAVATWRLNPESPPEPTSATLHIEIHENACSSRRDPTGRTLPPEVDFGPDEIVITMSVLEIGGRCPGNPYFPMTIQLTEPIGNRTLVDGYDRGVRWQPLAMVPTPSPPPPPVVTPRVTEPPPVPDEPFELVGVLVRSSGYCGYLLDDQGLTWELHWPHYIWAEGGEDPEVHDPTQLVAVEGARLTLIGHSMRGSLTCDSEPRFEVTDIVRVDPTADQSPRNRAITTSLNDPLMADYVNGHSQKKWSASPYNPPGVPGNSLLVTVHFEGYADDYPLDSCDIARDIDRPIGVAWLFDSTGTTISARSPIWRGDIRCF